MEHILTDQAEKNPCRDKMENKELISSFDHKSDFSQKLVTLLNIYLSKNLLS